MFPFYEITRVNDMTQAELEVMKERVMANLVDEALVLDATEAEVQEILDKLEELEQA